MQFASPTRNNNIRDCQTSNCKVRSHFTFYSLSINLTFFEVETSFTSQKDRLVAGQLLQNRRETVPHLRIGWIQNGEWSSSIKQHCSRRLKEAGLVAHVDMQKPLLTAIPHRKRLQFAMAHTDWTWVDWSIMIVLGVMGQDSLSFKMMVVCL